MVPCPPRRAGGRARRRWPRSSKEMPALLRRAVVVATASSASVTHPLTLQNLRAPPHTRSSTPLARSPVAAVTARAYSLTCLS